MALAEAFGRLIQDAKLRFHYVALDARESNNISESSTGGTAIELLQTTPGATTKSTRSCASRPRSTTVSTYGAAGSEAPAAIAYLIERWPDRDLPLLERELEEMKRRHVPIVPIVCELNSRARYTRTMEKMAPSLEFLPDAMVIEAEWRANHAPRKNWKKIARSRASGPKCHLFAAGAFCSRVDQAA